jgi:hypothetical protein
MSCCVPGAGSVSASVSPAMEKTSPAVSSFSRSDSTVFDVPKSTPTCHEVCVTPGAGRYRGTTTPSDTACAPAPLMVLSTSRASGARSAVATWTSGRRETTSLAST